MSHGKIEESSSCSMSCRNIGIVALFPLLVIRERTNQSSIIFFRWKNFEYLLKMRTLFERLSRIFTRMILLLFFTDVLAAVLLNEI